MLGTHREAEQLAFEFYERNGYDPAEPVDPFTLTSAFLGPGTIIRTTGLVSGPAATFVVNGKRKIALRHGLRIEDAAFYCAHELGHIVFDELGYHEDDLEAQCDLFAAALLAPRPAVVQLHRAFGFDLPSIADHIGSTETWAALRIGEVLRLPLAVVATKVRVRGPEEWVWPDEPTLRQWARRPPPGIAKVRLTDDPRRAVIRPDDTRDVG
jgi:hypothetical protein